MLRIGMLTSGGDCQALKRGNARRREKVSARSGMMWRSLDFKDGYKGLIYGGF